MRGEIPARSGFADGAGRMFACGCSWRRVLVACVPVVALFLVTACATKTVPPPAVSTPHYPDFVFPAAPAGIGTAATLERHKAGWQWLQIGDLKAAERNFAASLKLTPDFYPAEAGLGYVALARKDHDAALEHFDRAVVANPRYAPALDGRGDALLAAGQRDTALKSFEAAAAADPTLQSLQSRIDVLRLRVLQDDVAAARKAAESGKLADARQAYLQAIAASPQSPFLYRELAAVEKQDNDLAAALVHAQKASELDPSDARALVLTGEILEARGAFDAALQTFSAALALEPNDVSRGPDRGPSSEGVCGRHASGVPVHRNGANRDARAARGRTRSSGSTRCSSAWTARPPSSSPMRERVGRRRGSCPSPARGSWRSTPITPFSRPRSSGGRTSLARRATCWRSSRTRSRRLARNGGTPPGAGFRTSRKGI